MELFSFQGQISGQMRTISVRKSGELFIVSSGDSILVHLRRISDECLVYGRAPSKLSKEEIDLICSEIQKRVYSIS
ncbi:hypothetical protein [Pararcticibacter amylolyticus]|uniref:hypothetical protein n=1 Tax=Pararcticibacter amylolyticus TaxID=2173175 RepID=UPI0011B23286|nr:hypothetical protein [Pararcticibacter amylolyticus]